MEAYDNWLNNTLESIASHRQALSKKETKKKMSEADDNNQPSNQKASYPVIWSLLLSMCGASCFLAFYALENLPCCIGLLGVPCCALASLLGIVTLCQRSQSYPRLWWLAIVGISISAVSIILFVILTITNSC